MGKATIKYASGMVTLAAVLSSGAAILTNDTLQIDSPTSWSGVTNIYNSATVPGAVNANFTLDGRSYVRVTGSSKSDQLTDFYFGTNANDVAVVIRGNSGLALSYRNSTSTATWVAAGIDPAGANGPVPSYINVHAGLPDGVEGSTGRVFFNPQATVVNIFGGNFLGALWMLYLYVEPSITPGANGYVDLLQLDQGAMSDIGVMFVRHAKPVRILFNGGEYHINNSTRAAYGYLFQVPAGKSLILEGINGRDVYIGKRFTEPFFTDGVSGGDVYVRGRDVAFYNYGTRAKWASGYNYFPYKLRTADRIHWEHTGNLKLLPSTWFQCRDNDVLPHGATTGGLVVKSSTGSMYVPGNATGDLGYSCLDLYGTTQRVNSAVSELNTAYWHRGYLTNSTPTKVGVLRLGTHDDDGTYNLFSWPGTEVWKEGSGTLSVQSSEGPTLKVFKGTAIFSLAKNATLPNVFTNLTVAAGATVSGEVNVLGTLTLSGTGAQTQGGLSLKLGGAATIAFENGATELSVAQLCYGGQVINEGTYTSADLTWLGAGGTLKVLADGPVAKTGTFVWQGGTDNNSAETAANWSGTAPALTSGGEELDFSAGTAAVNFGAAASVNGMLFNRTDGETFAMSGAKLKLGVGGLTVGGVGATLDNAIALATTPQTWKVAMDATLTVNGPISSLGFQPPLVIAPNVTTGAVTLAGDNASLAAPLLISNVCVTAKSATALGGAQRTTKVFATDKRGLTDTWIQSLIFAGDYTIATPLELVGSFGPLGAEGRKLTFTGAVRMNDAGITQCIRVPANAEYTFSGGFDCYDTSRFFFPGYQGASVRITGKPLVAGGTAGGCTDLAVLDSTANGYADQPFTLKLDVSGNEWRLLRIYAGRIVCGAKNALSSQGRIAFGRTDWTSSRLPEKYTIDLGGYDQQLGGFATEWSVVPGNSTYWAERYAVVTSAVPAVLTLTPRYSYDHWNTNAVVRFRGEAGFRFAPTTYNPILALQNFTSDTKGALEVLGGKLTFKGGAGWVGSTNVTVAGSGLLVVDADSAAVAFGTNGAYTVLHLADQGKLSLPAGQTVVTRMLEIDGVRMRRGTYGGADSGASVINTDHFTANGGVLRVRFSAEPGTMMMLR